MGQVRVKWNEHGFERVGENKLKKQRVIRGLAGIFQKNKKRGLWKREKQHRVQCCCVSFSSLLQRDTGPDGFTIRFSGG